MDVVVAQPVHEKERVFEAMGLRGERRGPISLCVVVRPHHVALRVDGIVEPPVRDRRDGDANAKDAGVAQEQAQHHGAAVAPTHDPDAVAVDEGQAAEMLHGLLSELSGRGANGVGPEHTGVERPRTIVTVTHSLERGLAIAAGTLLACFAVLLVLSPRAARPRRRRGARNRRGPARGAATANRPSADNAAAVWNSPPNRSPESHCTCSGCVTMTSGRSRCCMTASKRC